MSVITAIDQIDRRLVCAVSRWHHRRFFWIVKRVSQSGDGYVQLGCLVLAAVIDSAVASALLSVGLVAFGIERVLYVVAKRYFKRQRPEAALSHFVAAVVPSDCFSFPSGHTMAAFLLASLLYQLVGLPAWLVFGWAAAVGCSRVLVGVHFPSDILAGAGLGLGIAAVSISVVM